MLKPLLPSRPVDERAALNREGRVHRDARLEADEGLHVVGERRRSLVGDHGDGGRHVLRALAVRVAVTTDGLAAQIFDLGRRDLSLPASAGERAASAVVARNGFSPRDIHLPRFEDCELIAI